MHTIRTILALSAAVLLHSSIAGAQWAQTTGPYEGAIGLVATGASVVALTGAGSLARTTDGGVTWVPVGTATVTYSVIVGSGASVYALTRRADNSPGDLISSVDGGVYWVRLLHHTLNEQNLDVRTLLIIPNGAGPVTYMAGSDRGVFRVFGSISWYASNTGLTNTDVRALAGSGANIFAGTAGGVFRSADNGATWTAVNSGLASLSIRALVVAGTSVFAGTDAGGIFRSTNNGATWTAVNTGLTNHSIRTLAVSGGTVVAGSSHGGVFRTSNGTVWAAISTNANLTDVRALAISGSNLFAGVIGGGVQRYSLAAAPVGAAPAKQVF